MVRQSQQRKQRKRPPTVASVTASFKELSCEHQHELVTRFLTAECYSAVRNAVGITDLRAIRTDSIIADSVAQVIAALHKQNNEESARQALHAIYSATASTHAVARGQCRRTCRRLGIARRQSMYEAADRRRQFLLGVQKLVRLDGEFSFLGHCEGVSLTSAARMDACIL